MLETIGQMRDRINIVSRPQTPGSNDLVNYGFSVFATRWAFVEPVKGSQYLNNQQIDSSITHRVIVRWERFITSELFIQYEQTPFLANVNTTNSALISYQYLRIKDVKNLFNRRRFLILNCEEYYQT